MQRVFVAPDAREFIKREAAYLRQHSEPAAARFLMSLRSLKERLSRFPQAGAMADNPALGRQIAFGQYVAYYDLRDRVIITHMRHGRQRQPGEVFEDGDE